MILDEIVAVTRERVRLERTQTPLELLREIALARNATTAEQNVANASKGFELTGEVRREQAAAGIKEMSVNDFMVALRVPGLSFICEVKKASPSKGVIAPDFPYLRIAKEYEVAGAAAVSVLTEPTFFQGSDDYLREIVKAVSLPVLRKDFIIDEYQIWQAGALSANAVLLIVAILDDTQLASYLKLCAELRLAALVEVHDATELTRALQAGAQIIGVNNRDLTTFEVSLGTTEQLAPLVPAEVLLVSESGIVTAADVARVCAVGVDAVLVGETLMRAANKTALLGDLRAASVLGAGAGRPIGRASHAVVLAKKQTNDSQQLVQERHTAVSNSQAGLTQCRLKICGLKRRRDVAYVNAAYERYAAPQYVGFVFATSKRLVSAEMAAMLRRDLNERIASVGVFVDQPVEFVRALVVAGTIGLVQLHGHEDAGYIARLRTVLPDTPIIKAVRMALPGAVALAQQLDTQYLLLDSDAGSGKVFDWSMIPQVDRPFFLAGGISADNIHIALNAVYPYAIDVSSGAETDGVKDAAKIIELARIVSSFERSSHNEHGADG
ncbi:MAG: indole-3-glycerol phosphate synthase TrpC [Propionibacteriaceae bacterium]|nr:indole-3-glycerol phosphate synthase TrpC [Propionibacteriaceae bacterium]